MSRVRGAGGKSLGQFFIHGLGHFLGLEAHDAGGVGAEVERAWLRLRRGDDVAARITALRREIDALERSLGAGRVP